MKLLDTYWFPEGFQSIEDISFKQTQKISQKLKQLDEDTAKAIQSQRSKESLVKVKEEVGKRLKELGVEEARGSILKGWP